MTVPGPRTVYLVMDEKPDIPEPRAVFESPDDAAKFVSYMESDGNQWVRTIEIPYWDAS